MQSKDTKDIKLFYIKISVVLSSVKRQRILSFLNQDFSCFIISKNTKDFNIFIYIDFSCFVISKNKKDVICFSKRFLVGFLLRGFLVLN